jgi:sulfatase maturation enzyme AslB (radical SAM superfamily)
MWQHLNSQPDGHVTFCCFSDYTNSANLAKDFDSDGNVKHIYNLNTDKIHDILNNDNHKMARTQMLNGDRPPACSRCFTEEDKGLPSRRTYELMHFSDFTKHKAEEITDKNGYIDEIKLGYPELRLGTTCNVKCRTCNAGSSSLWQPEFIKLRDKVNFKIHGYHNIVTSDKSKWADNTEFWEDLLTYSDSIEECSINGGEPTLIKSHFKFLHTLIEKKLTHIKLRYNINMTIMSEEIIDIWKQFDKVEIGCSIDDIGVRNEYIRYPTDWDTVMRNFLRLREEKFELSITQTISFMNLSTVVDFYKYFAMGYGVRVIHNFVHYPSYLSPDVLPDDLKNKYINEIVDYFQGDEHKNSNDYKIDPNRANRFIALRNVPQDKSLWDNAINFTLRLDEIRNHNISDYLPEFKEIIKNVQ